jgi:DNA polymerase zeta
MMVRLARTQNYVLISPSIEQRNHQNAMQCIPLVIEPASAYYTSPVVRSSIV